MKVIQLLRSSPFGIEGSYLLCFRFQLFKASLPIPTAEFRVIYNLQHAFNLFGAEFIFIRIFLATTCGFIIGSCIAPSPQVGRWLMLGYYLLMGGAIVFRLLGVESGVRYLTGGTEVAAMTLAAILSFFVVCEDNLRKIGRPVSEEK